MKTWVWIVIGIIGLWLFIIFLLVMFSPNSIYSNYTNEFGEKYKIDKFDACYMSHQFVEPSLKAPLTAKFENCRDALITYKGNRTYHVYSYVDAQNEFGAMIRTSYSIDLTDRGANYWYLENITIYE